MVLFYRDFQVNEHMDVGLIMSTPNQIINLMSTQRAALRNKSTGPLGPLPLLLLLVLEDHHLKVRALGPLILVNIFLLALSLWLISGLSFIYGPSHT